MSVTDVPAPKSTRSSGGGDSGPQDVGVPEEAATAHDFIMVRAELIRILGGANEAIVWARINYRGKGDWWTASMDEISLETGLTVRQIRRAIEKLLDLGALQQEKLRAGGSSDHTYSYRVVIRKGHIDVTKRSDQEVTERSDLPYKEEVKKKTIVHSDEEAFENAWKEWPRKDAKKAAGLKFAAAVRSKKISAAELQKEIARFGAAFRRTRSTEYTPMLATWINQERWNDPLPTTTQKAGQAIPAPYEPPRKIWDPRKENVTPASFYPGEF